MDKFRFFYSLSQIEIWFKNYLFQYLQIKSNLFIRTSKEIRKVWCTEFDKDIESFRNHDTIWITLHLFFLSMKSLFSFYIAETCWQIHIQSRSTWTQKLDLRPSVEKF
jgi:hypothetical protein